MTTTTTYAAELYRTAKIALETALSNQLAEEATR